MTNNENLIFYRRNRIILIKCILDYFIEITEIDEDGNEKQIGLVTGREFVKITY